MRQRRTRGGEGESAGRGGRGKRERDIRRGPDFLGDEACCWGFDVL